MKFNPLQVGVYTGILLAVIHAIWAFLVMIGLAGPLLSFALGLHFLNNPYTVKPFSFGNALMLVVFVFLVWFVLGYLATVCWNKMQRGK